MAIFGREKDEAIEGEVPATALVVHAESPPEGILVGGYRSHVRVLVDAGSGPVSVERGFKLDKDRWLVDGMEVPVTIDPSRPDRFEVEWDSIPSIEQRAAANDPTLADPLGAKRKVAEALRSAGLAGPDLAAIPGGIGELAGRSEQAEQAATPDRFKEAMEKAEREPVPSGKVRAVVQIATIRGHLNQDEHGRNEHEVQGKSSAVLAVNVPGRAPYAVYVERFKVPHGGKWDVAGAGLPALVSASDPNDVEVLWKELPSIKDQVSQRIADGMQGAAAGIGESAQMQEQMTDALKQAGGTPGAGAAPGAAAMQGLPPGMRKTMARNAQQALKFVKDPAQRQMLIDQYKAAGIEVDEGTRRAGG